MAKHEKPPRLWGVNIAVPEPLYRRIKADAALKGTTVKDAVIAWLHVADKAIK